MKKILMTAAAVFILTAFAGCGVGKAAKPLTIDKYKETSKTRGMTVEVREDEASTTCNGTGENYNSQFYVFDTVIKCDAAYEYLISRLVTLVKGENVTTEKTETEYKKFVVTSTEVYGVAIQAENTLLYVYSLSDEGRSGVDDYIEELGY